MTILNRLILLKENASPIQQLRHEFPVSPPHELLGFLRACQLETPLDTNEQHIKNTVTRLRKTHKWRAEIGLEEAMNDDHWVKNENQHRSLLQYDIVGNDVHGRPILVELVGRWNVERILANSTNDPAAFTKLHAMTIERLTTMERTKGCLDPRGQVVIMDCLGLSRAHFSLVSTLQSISQVDADHFPDTLAELYVVNAPYIFTALAALCRPFVSSETLQKFHVSSGVPEALLEFIAPQVLPAELGGVRKDCFPYDSEAPPTSIAAHTNDLETNS